jgi:hypothetical protein
MRVILPNTSPYTKKDQAKSDRATCFIGRGSLNSSTRAYSEAWGKQANMGNYRTSDTVFLSVEGARTGRQSLDTYELILAIKARATILTDTVSSRLRAYNVGEREAANYLLDHKYEEVEPGVWHPSNPRTT